MINFCLQVLQVIIFVFFFSIFCMMNIILRKIIIKSVKTDHSPVNFLSKKQHQTVPGHPQASKKNDFCVQVIIFVFFSIFCMMNIKNLILRKKSRSKLTIVRSIFCQKNNAKWFQDIHKPLKRTIFVYR